MLKQDSSPNKYNIGYSNYIEYLENKRLKENKNINKNEECLLKIIEIITNLTKSKFKNVFNVNDICIVYLK